MADVLCPVVIGRSVEVDALGGVLEAARVGGGSVAFLVGEAGIGKSRLARELIVAAHGAGMVVLRGRAVPGAQTVALRPLAEAFVTSVETLWGAGPVLDPWLRALSGMVPGVDAPQIETSSAVHGEAVVRALRWLCRGRGGLLVLEDVHWADPDTLAVIEHLSDHLDQVPVLCLVTVHGEEPSGGRDLVRTIARRRSALVLELGRLSDAQAVDMVRECTGGDPGVDVTRRRRGRWRAVPHRGKPCFAWRA